MGRATNAGGFADHVKGLRRDFAGVEEFFFGKSGGRVHGVGFKREAAKGNVQSAKWQSEETKESNKWIVR